MRCKGEGGGRGVKCCEGLWEEFGFVCCVLSVCKGAIRLPATSQATLLRISSMTV